MKLTEPESLVYAAAFVAAIGHAMGRNDLDGALAHAAWCVLQLRSVKVHGRTVPSVNMWCDFMNDGDE